MLDLPHGKQKMLNGFSQLRTHIQINSYSFIDLIFTDQPKSISKFGSSFFLVPKLSSPNCLLYF